MTIYLLLILIVIGDFLLEKIVNEKYFKKKYSFTIFDKILKFVFKWRVISIFAFVLIFTLRSYNVGLDTYNYYNYYSVKLISRSQLFEPISSSWEFGFTFINGVFAFLGLDFRWLLFFIAIFVSISFVNFSNKVSSDKMMTMILFVCLAVFAQALNTLRQIISMAIILFVIIKLLNKRSKDNLIYSCILIFVASLFHVSALCCIVFILAKYIKPKWWLVVAMFGVTILGSFAFPYVMKFIEAITPLKYYSLYFVDYTGYIVDSNLVNNLYSIALIIVFFVLYIARFKLLKLNRGDEEKYDFFLMIFIFVPLIRVAGFILNAQALFNRLSMYFFMILIVLIPLFVEGLKFNDKLYYSSLLIVYIIAFGYMYYIYTIKLSCGVHPYKFMWEKKN